MKVKDIFRYLAALLIIFILWHLFSIYLNTPVLPGPLSAVVEFVNSIDKLYLHIFYSLMRILTAVLISIVLGVPTGLLIGRYESLNYLFSPIVYMLYPIPKIAFLPIVMLLLGLGDAAKIVLIFIILFFQIIVTCRDESAKIKKELFYFMESLNASEFDVFYHLVLPQCLPAIFTSIRLSLGTAIAILFFSENFCTDWGIGYFIIDSWMRVNYSEMFAGILGLSLMGILLFLSVDIIEKRICRWNN
jgi:NitT/TauT family transport system permease protein